METPEEQATDPVDDATSAPPRLPPMGEMGHGELPPPHTMPFAIERNVSRIATQIAEGRPATFD